MYLDGDCLLYGRGCLLLGRDCLMYGRDCLLFGCACLLSGHSQLSGKLLCKLVHMSSRAGGMLCRARQQSRICYRKHMVRMSSGFGDLLCRGRKMCHLENIQYICTQNSAAYGAEVVQSVV